MSQPSPQVSDQELLYLLRDPNAQERGFRLLMRTYGERLYWHIRQMLTFHDQADEVLQNVWIKVFRGIHTFRGDAQLFTWLYRIATNETITHINKRKQPIQSLDDDLAPLSQQIQADTFFDGDHAQALLQAAVEQLPPKQRQVFCMRYYEEMSYKEISDILQTSEGALKASYHHAAKKIEDFLQNRL